VTNYLNGDATRLLRFDEGEITTDNEVAEWLLAARSPVCPVEDQTTAICSNCHGRCDVERDRCAVTIVCRNVSIPFDGRLHQCHAGEVVRQPWLIEVL